MASKKREKDLRDMETRLREKVSGCISSIEVVLARWDTSKEKPEGLEGKIGSFRMFHSELLEWLNESLRGNSKTEAISGRLEKFVLIMHGIDEERKGGANGV